MNEQQANQQLMMMISELQMRDSISTYNRLVQRVFRSCVKDFRNNTLDKKESKCVDLAAEKWLRHSQRTGARFAEHQAREQAKMQTAAAQQAMGAPAPI